MNTEPQKERMAEVRDLSTGYTVVITRVENVDYSIHYEYDLFRPNPPEGEDGLVDESMSVPVLSDGTGHVPIWEPKV